MKRLFIAILLAGVFGAGTSAAAQDAAEPKDGGVVLAVGVKLASTAGADEQKLIRSLAAAAVRAAEVVELKIDYPLDGSIFPPDMLAPTFLWHDGSERADRWLIDVALADGAGHIYILAAGPPPSVGRIDVRCISRTNEVPKLTTYQASAKSWRPRGEVWAAIKAGSSARPAGVTIIGFESKAPGRVLSRGRMTLTTSKDPVGAPIFYRDVPLMPSALEKGVIKPLAKQALPLIGWRLRDVSRDDSRLLLENMPTCANCHSFSLDGKTLGMDIDGPSGDKGAYAIAPITEKVVIQAKDIITWNSFKEKPEDQKTIGFLSRMSPDGQYVVTTVNESLYVANFTDYRFLQVFYPTRGILAYYSRQTGEMKAVPGADDPDYVHCDPVWSPDGKSLVFARAKAQDPYIEGRKLAARANDPEELPLRYDLYRIPFNEGRGGRAEPVRGAADNGMSNSFPKVSPDGKWIVFVKCRNGQLMRPDSRLWIVPIAGGEAREMTCNTSRMNSWHSFSPNGRWMVFASKSRTPYTQMFLTHLDENGQDSPAILIPNATAANRAVNIPEFVNIAYDDLVSIAAPTVEYYRHFERGSKLAAEGRFVRAIVEFRRALKAEPTSARINNNLGVCLANMGRLNEALEHYRRALQSDPRSAMTHFNLGACLVALGKTKEGVEHYRKSIEIEPNRPKVHNNLAAVLARQGQTDQAIAHYRRALEISPEHATAHFNLGLALASQGKTDEAIRHWTRTVEINPTFGAAHFNLGRTFARQGKAALAIKHYRAALEINPRHVQTWKRLAWILATQPDAELRAGAEAVRLARAACRATNFRHPAYLDTLGAAYAEAGQFKEAIRTAENALRLARLAREDKLAKGIDTRLKLYRQKMPFRSALPQGP